MTIESREVAEKRGAIVPKASGDQFLFPWGPTLLPSDRMSHTILPGYLNCFGGFLFPATENLEYNYDYLKTSQI